MTRRTGRKAPTTSWPENTQEKGHPANPDKTQEKGHLPNPDKKTQEKGHLANLEEDGRHINVCKVKVEVA